MQQGDAKKEAELKHTDKDNNKPKEAPQPKAESPELQSKLKQEIEERKKRQQTKEEQEEEEEIVEEQEERKLEKQGDQEKPATATHEVCVSMYNLIYKYITVLLLVGHCTLP